MPCFSTDRDLRYTILFNEYDAITSYYKGWSLTEIRSLSVRERQEWIQRAAHHAGERIAAMEG